MHVHMHTSIHTVSPWTSVEVSPQNPVISDSEAVNLTCFARGGPGNTYQWGFNGSILENVMSDHIILSLTTARDNGGLYTCYVTNAAGSGNDSTNIFVFPLFTDQPSNAAVVIGQVGSFSCEAVAFPYPVYEWFKVGRELPPGASGQNTSTLEVATRYLDGSEGDYFCRVTSDDRSITSERATLYGMNCLPF